MNELCFMNEFCFVYVNKKVLPRRHWSRNTCGTAGYHGGRGRRMLPSICGTPKNSLWERTKWERLIYAKSCEAGTHESATVPQPLECFLKPCKHSAQ